MSEVKAKCKIIHDFALSIIDEIMRKNEGAEVGENRDPPFTEMAGSLALSVSKYRNLINII